MDAKDERAALEFALQGLPLGGVRYFERVGSTMDEAAAWLKEGAPNFALVVAEEQFAGRGRLGRRWFTAPKASLAFSLILREFESPRPALLTGLAALAVCEALESRYGLHPQIKWPNDILLQGRKVCGILTEARWQGERPVDVVIGIGVNLTHPAVPPAATLHFPATSLQEHLPHLGEEEIEQDRFPLLALILARVLLWLPRVQEEVLIQNWEQRLAYRHQSIQVLGALEDPDSLLGEGTLEGLTPEGNLLLRLVSGETQAVDFGEIRVRPSMNGGV
ncbi:MAG: biotin--[acetyl-CoA-carboxylase] ligase [Anaerolineales bacterium]|nr:biotin--[acetyl-CoA-carboxylase] ligase [Anaerolineales bacterium]MDW8447498.1 biotin--[acetyl-CoA-carboxylase] ligase [Anaerolineales bacterium]